MKTLQSSSDLELREAISLSLITMITTKMSRLQLRKSVSFNWDFDTDTKLLGSAMELAVATDNHELVRRMVNAGFPVDPEDNFNASPLMCARTSEMITLLIKELGANPDAEDEVNHTALLHFVELKRADFVHTLLENGASVNHTISRCPPLKIAACQDDERIGRILLAYGGTMPDPDKDARAFIENCRWEDNGSTAKRCCICA